MSTPGILLRALAAAALPVALAAPVGAEPASGLQGADAFMSGAAAAEIGKRIEQTMQDAGESAAPRDYAYGAYQRGYFLTAFSIALEQAKHGKAPAQTLLGELLSRGLGVKRDYAEAAGWYELAAQAGDAEALYALGRMRLEGLGVEQDDEKAAAYLEQAGSRGHAVALRELAYLLLQGRGVEKNPMLAAAHLRKAARAGDMDAQFALAGLFIEGVGVVKNEAEAARWFAEAARNGHVPAQVEYAILLFNGRGVSKDEAVAARWLRQAALADNPVAQVRLARLLAEGRGVSENQQEAARWYLLARRKGMRDELMEDALINLPTEDLRSAEAAAERWLAGRGGLLASMPAAAEQQSPAVDRVVR
jgi:uncharacterized protein